MCLYGEASDPCIEIRWYFRSTEVYELQIKGKYTDLLTSVKRPKAHSRGFTSVKCPLSVTGRVSVLGALILKKQYMNFFGTSIYSLFLLSVRVKEDVHKTGFRVTLTKNSPTFVTSIL